MSEADLSASGAVSCEGAPRDLGLDQGRALARAIRAEVADLPLRLRLEAAVSALLPDLRESVERDLRRYFPHMAERLDGLARGAGVRTGELAALLAREAGADARSAGLLVGLAPERTGAGALLGRGLSAGSGAPRVSAPDHDYASREHAIPWLVPALGGRNEAGLCVVGAGLPGGLPARGAPPACSAPALLLVQDCLQRFDTALKAIEWCEGRPAGGSASLLLADATGDVAEVVIEGSERRVRRPVEGVLVGAGAPDAGESARKALQDGAPIDAGRFGRVLTRLAPSGRAVVFDPAGDAPS